MDAQSFQQKLQLQANDKDAVFLQKFFKTGAGEYGEGDVFLGVRVPQTRAICKEFIDLPFEEIQILLDSEVHEYRLAGLIIMTLQFAKTDADGQKRIYDMYVENVYAGRVNNWDLVDASAPNIIGAYLWPQRHIVRDVLYPLAGG